jgi:predicted ATPase
MFKHALVRDIAYSSLPKAPRQQLHLRVGEAVRDLLPERAATEPEVVAYHLAQAGLKQPAVEWWSKAGDLALRRSATVEAIAHLEKALVLSRDLGDSTELRLSRMRLLILYGNALRVARGFAAPETTSAFVQAYEIAGTVGTVPERFAALHGLWTLRFQHADLAAMREVARDFLREVDGEPGSPETGVAHRIGGVTRFLAGEFAEARQHLERALAHYDRDRDRPLMFRYGLDLAVPAMAYLAMTLWLLGIDEDAHGLVEQALTRAAQIKHKPTLAHAYAHAMGFEMLRRNPARSGAHGRDLFDFAHRHGLPAWLPYGGFGKGWAKCHAGDKAGGVTQMRDSLRPLREQGGYQTVLPLLAVLLAEAESEAGYHEAALATIDAELARIARTGVCFLLAEAHRVRGEILLRSKSPDAGNAAAAFIRAIEAARRQSASRLEFRAASRLARFYADRGKRVDHTGLLSILGAWPGDGSEVDGMVTGPTKYFADQSG